MNKKSISDKIFSMKWVRQIRRIYISFFRWLLEYSGYKFGIKQGTNNLLANFLDLICLCVYCFLSGYNTFKTFNINKQPSYVMFTLNLMCLIRFYIGNLIKIHDAKKQFMDKNCPNNGNNIHVRVAAVLIIIEFLSIVCSGFFILVGRLWKMDILGVRSASAVAWISLVIVLVTLYEGLISIGSNMFKAKPRIYGDIEEEGVGE